MLHVIPSTFVSAFTGGEILQVLLFSILMGVALANMNERAKPITESRSVVGIVIPAGYSFNLDGTSIYLAMAVVFLAQVTNAHLSIAQELGLMALLLLTSKGAAAVTGGGFITLAATLSSTHNTTLVAGLAILIGVDRFMSEARAITNFLSTP